MLSPDPTRSPSGSSAAAEEGQPSASNAPADDAAAAMSRPASARVINSAMQQRLNLDHIDIRMKNELYLRQHPEIRHILDYFVTQVLVQQPEDIGGYALELFSDQALREKVEKHSSECQQLDASELDDEA
ncbi:uncharacterized protein EV422DRAFT_613091 [Fimicolochytrium jonesii]|uniref:uncharacterized protein n=1 Tax=Fimicolochytrium jonesii TaxID=1396493 RepID=UPI0022FE0D5B|nr:uncharacterized protein EV422DRAFT_613091 [Fimicolochytrium jonesii]KAI8823075.1 hypothetical protein EV422DRAFT_613091 [Fimicolochytrium jonesii]